MLLISNVRVDGIKQSLVYFDVSLFGFYVTYHVDYVYRGQVNLMFYLVKLNYRYFFKCKFDTAN